MENKPATVHNIMIKEDFSFLVFVRTLKSQRSAQTKNTEIRKIILWKSVPNWKIFFTGFNRVPIFILKTFFLYRVSLKTALKHISDLLSLCSLSSSSLLVQDTRPRPDDTSLPLASASSFFSSVSPYFFCFCFNIVDFLSLNSEIFT